MKYPYLLVLTLLLATACTRAASTPVPTGLPLDFPDTPPAVIFECQSADLQSSANFHEVKGTIVLGITLTNQTKKPCTLSNPAQISLLNSSGKPIRVQSSDKIASSQTPPAPTNLQLAPSESTIITVIWQNYCDKLPDNSLITRIQLSAKDHLDIPLKMTTLPSCEASSEVSTISIMPYSAPP